MPSAYLLTCHCECRCWRGWTYKTRMWTRTRIFVLRRASVYARSIVVWQLKRFDCIKPLSTRWRTEKCTACLCAIIVHATHPQPTSAPPSSAGIATISLCTNFCIRRIESWYFRFGVLFLLPVCTWCCSLKSDDVGTGGRGAGMPENCAVNHG